MVTKRSARIPPPLGGSTAEVISIDGINATANNDVFDATGSVFQVDIDASLNSGEDVYLKFYDNLTPTIGTDDAEMVLKGKAGQVTPYLFPRGIPFGTAISVACSKTAGGTEGVDNPSGTVDVQILVGATP